MSRLEGVAASSGATLDPRSVWSERALAAALAGAAEQHVSIAAHAPAAM